MAIIISRCSRWQLKPRSSSNVAVNGVVICSPISQRSPRPRFPSATRTFFSDLTGSLESDRSLSGHQSMSTSLTSGHACILGIIVSAHVSRRFSPRYTTAVKELLSIAIGKLLMSSETTLVISFDLLLGRSLWNSRIHRTFGHSCVTQWSSGWTLCAMPILMLIFAPAVVMLMLQGDAWGTAAAAAAADSTAVLLSSTSPETV
mmetsp:Transcript_5563/g.13238  ORF Transcript_5563/g.13238 Transcript_5563/m.13238 type:complete len:203 (+) Transcript_5563:104-712(+)